MKDYSLNGEERGNFILAGHSGTGWKAFFNELYRLNIGDEAYITNKGKKYTYKFTNICWQERVGSEGGGDLIGNEFYEYTGCTSLWG